MNALDSYLAGQGIANADFARRLGVSEATVSRLRRNKQAPSFALVARIRAATNGAVSADDFLPAETSEGAAA